MADKSIKDFQEYEIWDLKYTIAYFIVPRLRAYIDKVRSEEFTSIPIWVKHDYDIQDKSEEKLIEMWSNLLKEILFPFEYLIETNRFYEMDLGEVESKKERGLQLFAKYFNHLWD